MKTSPTARSLQVLRNEGWTAQLVEARIPGTNRSRDLFGFIDIIAVRDGVTLAVQTTDTTNVSARVRKIADAEHVGAVRRAGWKIIVHGWYSDGRLREVDLS